MAVQDQLTNWKRVCNFLLVINSNLDPTWPPFRDIAGLLLKEPPHPYSASNLRMFPSDLQRAYMTEKLLNSIINKNNNTASIKHQTVRWYSSAVSNLCRRPFPVLSARCNFQDFQGPKSFFRTFQGLKIWPKNSRTFQDFPSGVWNL